LNELNELDELTAEVLEVTKDEGFMMRLA
jgi:hypothetical protein